MSDEPAFPTRHSALVTSHMEPTTRVELVTSSLPRTRSATELRGPAIAAPQVSLCYFAQPAEPFRQQTAANGPTSHDLRGDTCGAVNLRGDTCGAVNLRGDTCGAVNLRGDTCGAVNLRGDTCGAVNLRGDTCGAVNLRGDTCGAANGQGRVRTSVARKERQIYSLVRLTTPPPVRKCRKPMTTAPCQHSLLMSWRRESNPRPADYKSAALPTELRQRQTSKCNTRQTALSIPYPRHRTL